jgi:uncharacterized membrane protein HdeD (DUF308 family)
MVTRLVPRWSGLLLRAFSSVAFGFLALAYPGVTLAVLTVLFATYALVDGVVTLLLAAKRGRTSHRWLLVVDGLIGVGAGIATLAWPGLTLLVLVLLVGLRFVMGGLSQIAAAIALRRELDTPVLYGLGGVASVALGVVAFVAPTVTARLLVTWLGIYAVVFGLVMGGLALRLRHVQRLAYRPA